MHIASPCADSDILIPSYCRYCYLLEDLTPQLLAEKCPTYDSLGEYLRMRGREAYLEKKVVRGSSRFLLQSVLSGLYLSV